MRLYRDTVPSTNLVDLSQVTVDTCKATGSEETSPEGFDNGRDWLQNPETDNNARAHRPLYRP